VEDWGGGVGGGMCVARHLEAPAEPGDLLGGRGGVRVDGLNDGSDEVQSEHLHASDHAEEAELRERAASVGPPSGSGELCARSSARVAGRERWSARWFKARRVKRLQHAVACLCARWEQERGGVCALALCRGPCI
jgi:hypothetical protein